MPRIAVIIYVDHQETIQYPVGYIVSQLGWASEVWLFGGDETSTGLISQACGPRHGCAIARNINHKIVEPQDIAIGRNKTQKFVLEHSNCDWFVVLSADTLPTPRAVDRIMGLIGENITAERHISTHMVELYCDVGCSAWGCTLLPRSFAHNQWTADGSFFVNTGGGGYTMPPECLHLGYIGTDQVGRHITQHASTWVGNGHERHQLYRRDRAGFVKRILSEIREKLGAVGAPAQRNVNQLTFIDEPEFWNPARFAGVDPGELPHRVNAEYLAGEYMKAVDGLGLRDDLNFVKSIANQIGRHYRG